ncbi:hypothetical protein, partial [Roseibium sp.]|uniref:hypothetical protein n=1 Tax=Roseibium sp. TaxID=1936156 RepID=UPI003265B5CB
GLAHPKRIRNHLYPTTGSGAALNGQSHASSRLPPGSTEPKHPQGATSKENGEHNHVLRELAAFETDRRYTLGKI